MSFRNAKGGYIRPGYDPLEVANPPTGAGASAGNQSASVSFTAPSNTGGGAITNYYAVSNPGQITASSVTSPISVSGLTNGTEYTFKVWGENSYGPSAYSAPTGSVTPAPPYIEDVFSTYLYTGNGSTQTITNGIDLSGEGGLVWIKSRGQVANHRINDTAAAIAGTKLASNTTAALATEAAGLTSFNSNGFSIGSDGTINTNNDPLVSWTFRQAEKFFDVVTWTGNGSGSRAISHNLGSTPGCIILKRTDTADDWYVVHRGATDFSYYGVLNSTAAFVGPTASGISSVNSTSFTVSSYYNGSGATWVAYLFAHDAGGFGANGTDNVISCGSYTGNGSATGPEITLGYEPQWVLIKRSSGGTAPWILVDTMRGMPVGGADAILYPDQSNAEDNADTFIAPTATGFKIEGNLYYANANGSTYIYIAIRRGPMKTPEAGTEVFAPVAYTGTGATRTITAGFPVDLAIPKSRQATGNSAEAYTRLIGPGVALLTAYNFQELSRDGLTSFASNTGVVLGASSSGGTNMSGTTYVDWNFRRAPGFFDVVCYTGNGTAGTAISHNLGVVPELVIVKKRSSTGPWNTLYQPSMRVLMLNASNEFKSASLTKFYFGNDSADVSPTSSTFTVASDAEINESGATFVSYLFASCSGVSKVGSYTGTGTTLQINCGFTGGARFVLIKRTDASASWYVWDSARGIVAGNDPYLLLNSTDAEVTNTDYVDTYSAGFEISSTAPAAINANGGTYIFLAIA